MYICMYGCSSSSSSSSSTSEDTPTSLTDVQGDESAVEHVVGYGRIGA